MHMLAVAGVIWIIVLNPEGVLNIAQNGFERQFYFGDRCSLAGGWEAERVGESEIWKVIEGRVSGQYGSSCPDGTLFFMEQKHLAILQENRRVRMDVEELLRQVEKAKEESK